MADLENIRIETETDGEIEDITIVTQKTFHTILSSSVSRLYLNVQFVI